MVSNEIGIQTHGFPPVSECTSWLITHLQCLLLGILWLYFFQRLIQRLRTAVAQVRTTTAVNEHGIAGYQMVTHIKALPTNGMARRSPKLSS